LDQISDRVAQRIAALQAQLTALDGQSATARGEEKATLSAQRGNVQAALALLKEVQGSMQDMQRFESYTLQGDNGGESGLAGQIADREKSVREVAEGSTASESAADKAKNAGGSANAGASGSKSAPGSSPATDTAVQFHPDSAGIVALVTEWFSVHGTQRQ